MPERPAATVRKVKGTNRSRLVQFPKSISGFLKSISEGGSANLFALLSFPNSYFPRMMHINRMNKVLERDEYYGQNHFTDIPLL